ncbi:P-loop containing nucleoside triphosphate hydrolase protein, partial [Gaertneriomyces semiglobifer]
MSPVQEAVLSLLPTEKDLLVKAKTGTGKTLAFLIAAVESALARRQGKPFNDRTVTIMCLAPTRELANQIAAEATKLLAHHRYRVHVAVGGPGRNRMVEQLRRPKVHVVVATPGRLLDMLQSVPDFKQKCQGIETLIFDEADLLLEMGFREALADIADHLPAERQTFMFSATLSKAIMDIAKRTLRPDYAFINAVPKNDTPTHLKVRQTYAVLPFSQQLPVLYECIRQHREANPQAKIMVFFPTTKIVGYLAGVFNDIQGMDVMEIHSRLTQQQRTRIAEKFRRARSGILFTSDVSARGVDYPGVTLVIQVGMPSSKDQYIHRVGRTGRAGASGEGFMMLSPYEKTFLKEL